MSVDYCDLSKKVLDALCLVVHNIDCASDCGCVDHEGIMLAHGNHVVTFRTEFRPAEVYVSLSPQGVPVCSGSLSHVSTSLLEDGFVLYAQVMEDSAVVKWIVKR